MDWSLRRLPVLAAAAGLALAAGASGAAAQGVAGPYDAREPISCPDRTEPAQGPLTNEQAEHHLRCTVEGIGDARLYLLGDVTVEVGEGRPYDPENDYFVEIDSAYPVYPITGSLERIVCDAANETNAGRNCTLFLEANARGACYKRTTGVWDCKMSDLVQQPTENYPPPQ